MAAEYTGKTVEELLSMDYVDYFIAMTLEAKSNTAIIPLQDYLHKGKEARINTPSVLGNNWSYRFLKDSKNDRGERKAFRESAIDRQSGRFSEKAR